jgi:hypothetical protein
MLREVILNTYIKLRSLKLAFVIPLCCIKQVYHVYMNCILVYMYKIQVHKVLFPIITLL